MGDGKDTNESEEKKYSKDDVVKLLLRILKADDDGIDIDFIKSISNNPSYGEPNSSTKLLIDIVNDPDPFACYILQNIINNMSWCKFAREHMVETHNLLCLDPLRYIHPYNNSYEYMLYKDYSCKYPAYEYPTYKYPSNIRDANDDDDF